MKRFLGALLLAMPFSAVAVSAFALLFSQGSMRAAASPAPYYEDGRECFCLCPIGETSVSVKRAELDFSIPSFPSFTGEGELDEEYAAVLNETLELYNPSGEAADVSIALPVGCLPEYGGKQAEACGTETSLKADGKLLGGETHYVYGLGTAPIMGGVYSRDTPVFIHTFTLQGLDSVTEGSDWVDLVFNFDYNPKKTVVFSSDLAPNIENGRGKLVQTLYSGDENVVKVFVAGVDISFEDIGLYRYENGKYGKISSPDAQIGETLEESTLAAVAEEARLEQKCEIGAQEWYEGYVSALQSGVSGRLDGMSVLPPICEEDFFRWEKYEVRVPAEGTLTLEAQMPLFPSLHGSLYTYELKLSMLRGWEEVEETVINIHTSAYIRNSNLTFTQVEDGYSFTRKGLPLGDLNFDLSESAREGFFFNNSGEVDPLRTALVILIIVVAAAVVLVTVLFFRSRRQKKLRKAEEERLLRGRAQEGSVDLPDEDEEKK